MLNFYLCNKKYEKFYIAGIFVSTLYYSFCTVLINHRELSKNGQAGCYE